MALTYKISCEIGTVQIDEIIAKLHCILYDFFSVKRMWDVHYILSDSYIP